MVVCASQPLTSRSDAMMTWILAMVAVLLLGGVAVVAAGRGAPMRQQDPDRSGELPGPGPLTAADLREVRFSTVVRGYAMAEVDALLSRLERQLAELERPPGAPDEGDAGDDAHRG